MSAGKQTAEAAYDRTGYANVADKFVTCVQREGSFSITSDDCDNLLSLLAQCASLREALRAMLNTYAPLAAETVVLEGEHALHSAVRQARAALALADCDRHHGEVE